MGIVENSAPVTDFDFWKDKKVFVTGHMGFKGSWLCLWLSSLGAKVTGYGLAPCTKPNLYEIAEIGSLVDTVIGDIRDLQHLTREMLRIAPEIVIHMAAQPLVRESYSNPVETYSTNVMGTANVLEGVRRCSSVSAVINVTTDKCYENREWDRGYKESDRLGGYDPYSSSKACSELVTSAYRCSFFNPEQYAVHGVAVASARAGNVIGGGDWAVDRLVPDCVRAFLEGQKIPVRNPHAIRPWQYVLEPLSGYLLLAQRLCEEGPRYAEAWNFGPNHSDEKPVEWVVKRACEKWGGDASYEIDDEQHPHEARYLSLDCSKSNKDLRWHPRWNLEDALDKVLEWTREYMSDKNMREVCLRQINEYCTRQHED